MLRETTQCPQLRWLLPKSSVPPPDALNHFSLPARWRGQGRGINQLVREKIVKAYVIEPVLCR